MGVAQVLEAVVIGVVVLGATFFAVSFQAPPSPDENPGSQQTETSTQSALRALNDLYIDDPRYNDSALSRAIAKAAGGNSDPLVDSIGAFMPSEASFCVYLNNGRARTPLHCPDEPPGTAVGASYPIEPNWRFHYAEPDLRYYDMGATTQMGFTEIPILNAHNVHDEGAYVRTEVTGEQAWQPGLDLGGGRAGVTEEAYTTFLQGDDSKDYPSASIYMQCRRSDTLTEPCYASDLTGGMNGYAPFSDNPTGGKVLRFTVENNGYADLADGTELEIRFPVGLDVNQTIGSHAQFTNITVDGADDSSVETVTAELDGALGTNATAHLDVEVNRTDTRYAYKKIDARLSHGAVSTSQLLLRVENKLVGEWTGGDSRVAMISTPKPAGSLDGDKNPVGRWGVVVPIPYGETQIEKLTFELPDGEKVLRSVDWPSDFNPSATYNVTVGSNLEKQGPSKFTWTKPGGQTYAGYEFAEFQFTVTTNGTQTQASERFPAAQPEAEFENYDPPPQAVQVEPGVWWQEHPPNESGTRCSPDCPGYDNGLGNLESNDVGAAINWRGVQLDGETDYAIADLTDAQRKGQKDALQATDLSVTPRQLDRGQIANIDIDGEDLALYIARESGVTDMRLETRIYAPWGIPQREPVETIDHGRVAGSFEVPNDLLPLHVDGDSSEDILTASTDGNVYSVEGHTGEVISGAVFGLPEGSGGKEASPTILAHGTHDTGDDMIGVGTSPGASNVYVLDGSLNERWSAAKPNGNVQTYEITLDRDLTGDGVPEVLLSTHEDSDLQTDHNWTRLTLWDGTGDPNGEGQPVDGWEDGIVTTGTANKLGMANLGVEATPGVYANTGSSVGANVDTVVNRTMNDISVSSLTKTVQEAKNAQAKVSGAGLLGFMKDGTKAFNLSGVRVLDAATVEEVTADSSSHSGIAFGGMDGWLWGTNASTPVYPVHGWSIANTRGYEDVSMANPVEGYLVTTAGLMLYTPSQWTTYDYYYQGNQTTVWTPETGVSAVDTPDAPYRSDEAAVSWWVGHSGTIIRSTDRLDSIERKGTVGKLVGSLNLNDPLSGPDLSLDGTLDLAKIDFNDVHAVSENEAWFVGVGNHSGIDGNGYIGHTVDGGETIRLLEGDCDAGTCGLNAIDATDEHLWAVGNNGTMLVRNSSGMAQDMRVTGDPVIDSQGRVDIPVRADEKVQIRNLTVSWSPLTKFEYGRSATLANDTSADRDLWNKTKGCSAYTAAATCTETYGYDRGNTMLVKDYVEDSNDGDNRTLDGHGNLTVGPFTADLVGYEDASWYENGLNLPVEWRINVTFDDGTEDIYQVTKNSTGTYITEASTALWTLPSRLDPSFETADCLGDRDDSCPDLNSVNVTDVGTGSTSYVGVVAGNVTGSNGTSLYGLAEGTRNWTAIHGANYGNELWDAAVNPHHPERWVAVGEGGQTLITYDGGGNWTPLPGTSDILLRAVDHTHPTVASLAGGVGTGERFTLNGYVQRGHETTEDLFTSADHPIDEIQRVNLTDPPTVYADGGGETPVNISVWDENANGGEGAWRLIYTAAGGTRSVNLAGPTDQLKLKFLLDTDGTVRLSPLVDGNMTLALKDDTDPARAADTNVTFDLEDDKSQFSGDFDRLEYNDRHGYLRLPAVRNPWMQQLGNDEEGDWSTARNFTHVDAGARMVDMDVAENGSTIWVLTGGIYQHGAGAMEPPIQDASCHSGQSAACDDNTLYAFDAETGMAEEWWDPMFFQSRPQMLEVGSEAVSVMTGNSSETSKAYWLPFDDPDKDRNYTMSEGWESAPVAMTVADAFPNSSETDDPIVAVQGATNTHGEVLGLEAPKVHNMWGKMPAMTDHFSFRYEVPDDALLGSRIVVTDLRWNITDTVGTELVQSARLHDTFEVTPGGGPMPLVPTYTLEVVAWIEDWR